MRHEMGRSMRVHEVVVLWFRGSLISHDRQHTVAVSVRFHAMRAPETNRISQLSIERGILRDLRMRDR